MATTTDDVEIDPALVERVRRFLTDEPVYIGCAGSLVERLVAGIANSRNEVMAVEETVVRLIRDDEIMLGEPEPDDLNADPRSWSGPFTRRVIWVE